MDDQYEQLHHFTAHLRRANDTLRSAAAELSRAHGEVDADWQDALRREYDRLYAPLGERVGRYLAHEGRAYEQFLAQKLAALGRYLHGD